MSAKVPECYSLS